MPKIVNLTDQHVSVEKGTEIEEPPDGDPVAHEVWTIVMTDRRTHEQLRLGMRRPLRDDVVRLLTGGIVLAGGDLPNMPPPQP